VSQNKVKKQRIDKLLVDRGLVSTRARAQAMVIAGHVLVNEIPVTKSGELVSIEDPIRLREPEMKYVSRAAFKLIGALDHFKVDAAGKIAIDVGSSTGGFTEVLLERGALQVYAIDVGTNQLAWKLRSDPRVVSRENYNARNFKTQDFPATFDLLVMDVSFISMRLILPAVIQGLNQGADLLVLFKPQFELGREQIGEGGIVQNQEHAQTYLRDTLAWAESHNLKNQGWTVSPVTGTDGNTEYLIHWVYAPKR
jgi:23S rRNA (cytidine1920-2'-O)/16S rRNA (cytidine1409-2'-O)-methyltransferase